MPGDLRQWIGSLGPDIRLEDRCDPDALRNAEDSLGHGLHDDLRSVLLAANGVFGEYELPLVWSLEQILERNEDMRTTDEFSDLYMPFDHLLFFGDAGNGSQFAYGLQGGLMRRPDIFVWDHGTDARNWVAPTIQTYLEWMLSGRIAV